MGGVVPQHPIWHTHPEIAWHGDDTPHHGQTVLPPLSAP